MPKSHPMNKRIIVIASIFGILAVVLGAFGAHGIKSRVSADELDTWKTAVGYHFYHTLALLFLAIFSHRKSRLVTVAAYSFSLGIVLFSGSLYLLSAKNILQIGWAQILGPITPVGGLLFITGWVFLLMAAIKNK